MSAYSILLWLIHTLKGATYIPIKETTERSGGLFEGVMTIRNIVYISNLMNASILMYTLLWRALLHAFS